MARPGNGTARGLEHAREESEKYEEAARMAAELGMGIEPRGRPIECCAPDRGRLADLVTYRIAFLGLDEAEVAERAHVGVEAVLAMENEGAGALGEVMAVMGALALRPVSLPPALWDEGGEHRPTLWLTGDTHGGNASRFSHRRHGFLNGLTADDVVVVLGDTGLMWPGAEAETLHFLKQMEERPYQVVFLLGNHDNYDWAEALPEVDAFGGRLRQVVAGGREWPGRYVCSDWAVLDLAGEHCLLCAHADSHDADLLFDRDDRDGMREARRRHQWYRIRHWSWWPQEALDLGAFGAFARGHAGEHFDAILTHDCPAIIHQRLPRGDLAGRPVTAQEELFDGLRGELDFGVWAHGHMHRDDLAYCDEVGIRLFCLYGGFRSIGELRDVASRPMVG